MNRSPWGVLSAGLICLALYPFSASAQSATDAGKVLREQPKPPALRPGPSQQIITPDAIEEMGPSDKLTATILVKGFRITGATLIPEAKLQEQIKDAIGQELTLEQLRAVGLVLTGYYVQQGYLARVILPPQEVRDGIVEFRVIEGQRGEILLNNQGDRIDPEGIQGFIDHRLAKGDALNLVKLGEALMIVNEQPGVKAAASVRPGTGEGDIDLVIVTQDKPLAEFSAGLNNTGSRSTGHGQAFGTVALNNPTGKFDAASLLVNTSKGAHYARGDYSIAAGYSGLRVGVNASYLKYKVTQDGQSALDSHGTAGTAGLTAFYPITRQDAFTLSLNGSADYKALRDYSAGSETGDRKIKVASLGVSGTQVDGLFGGGQNGFGLTLTVGNADLSGNASALTTDQAGRKTDGTYAKLGFQASRLQPLSESWLLSLRLSGQKAADNLDSTEQFSLGGSGGVRGYPSSEGSGDEGVLGSINTTYQFRNDLTFTPFFDFGRIRVNHTTYSGWNGGNASLKNSYNLYGTGIAANWAITDAIQATATIAAPIGNNPGKDTNGYDGDGRNLNLRGWFGLTATF